jgi:hypothetical protein
MSKPSLVLNLMLLLSLLLSGCGSRSPPDRQISEMSREFVREQSKQNQQVAQQSQDVAVAAQRLVEADAKARQGLVEAHAVMQKELQAERVGIDRQHQELEQERRELAAQRGRDPIIAGAITGLGTVVACLLPLFLAGYIIYVAMRNSSDAEAMSEYLVEELTADESLLLTGPEISAPQLESKAAKRGPAEGQSS